MTNDQREIQRKKRKALQKDLRLGVIGLGNIGGAIAANLVADGETLTVYDAEASRIETLVESGAGAASDPADVARASEITLLSLPTPEVVKAVSEQ